MEFSQNERGKIPSLDGLRAVSFLIVFFAHAGLEWIVPGRLGVAVFFFLSGYLITTLMIREHSRTGRISLRLFYLRRTLRILPPMYAILFGTLLFLWIAHQMAGITLPAICAQMFFYQNYYFDGGKGLIPGLGVLWSLAVEEHFYLLFPPLMLLLLVRRRLSYKMIAIILLCICGGIFAWRLFVVTHFPGGLEWAKDATDCRADSILFGCLLACWERTESCRHVFSLKNLERFVLPGAFTVLLTTLVIRNPLFRETLRYSMQAIALMPILYYLVNWPGSWFGKFLNMRWIAILGTLSYAMYLIHYTVLLEFARVWRSQFLVGLASLLTTIILAQLVYVWIEKPSDRARKLLHSRIAPVQPVQKLPAII